MGLPRLIALALLAVSSSSAATALYVDSMNTALGVQNLWLNIDGNNKQETWVGGINIYYGGSNPQVNGDPRIVFCLELFVNISLRTSYNSVVDYANTLREEQAAWLIDHVTPNSTTTGAALQLAIWDIMEDGGDGFSAGRLRSSTGTATTKAILDQAVNYEGLLKVGYVTTNAYVYNNTTTSGTAVQDFIGETPEPAAIVLMASGLLLIGLGRLRRRRRAAP